MAQTSLARLGLAWTLLYILLSAVDPGFFRLGDPPQGIEGPMALQEWRFQRLLYYSFVTLTTLGYGDVSPVSRIGEALATMEAAIGQLYLTVLVARLVGMQISQQPAE